MLRVVAVGRPPLPKEHGGWAMMATPPVIALLAEGIDLLGVMAALGWALAYCARGPLEALLGRAPTGRAGMQHAEPAVARLWLLIFGTAAATLLLPVIYLRPVTVAWLGGAVLIAAAVMYLAEKGQTRSFLAGALATAGLTVGGPLYYLAAAGQVGARGWTLALVSFAFFLGSVYRVKTLAREKRSTAFRLESLGFHVLAVAAAGVAAYLGFTHWLVAAVLLLPLGWAIYGAARAGGAVSLAAIGKGEQWLTIGFGLALALILRLQGL